jgi:hypothetical protein
MQVSKWFILQFWTTPDKIAAAAAAASVPVFGNYF